MINNNIRGGKPVSTCIQCAQLLNIPVSAFTSLVPRLPPLARNYCVTFELGRKSRVESRGGPDKLSSLRNNHMTILHSSLHKYILAVHDLHCIPRYISFFIFIYLFF